MNLELIKEILLYNNCALIRGVVMLLLFGGIIGIIFDEMH